MGAFKLSPQQRIVVIAMVVIALLFTGATVHRAGGDGDTAQHPGGFVEWMGRQFGGPPDADRKDLTGPCLIEDRLELDNCTPTATSPCRPRPRAATRSCAARSRPARPSA
jgi:hypothetical protein